MSALPAKRTFVLVKDLLFQEKYKLTHTETDLMAYIVNSLTWAMQIAGFNILSTKKITSDLPQISESTLESSLRTLKEMELIEVEMVSVPKWQNSFARGIKITSKGLKYNSKYYKVDEKKIIEALQQENLELKKQVAEINLENIEEKVISQEKENLAVQEENAQNLYEEIEDFETFVTTVKTEFVESSEPICNGVKGWVNSTIFYINSYKKLSIKVENNPSIQVKEAEDIAKFWKWLFKNKHRVGDVIDFEQKPTLQELNTRYLGQEIMLHDKKFKIYQILEEEKGFSVEVQDVEGKRVIFRDKNREIIFYEGKKLQEILLHLG